MTDISTADIFDAPAKIPRVQSCGIQFRQFGGRHTTAGPIRAVKCDEDDTLVKKTLSEPGNEAVLIVDGVGSLQSALLADLIGDMAV